MSEAFQNEDNYVPKFSDFSIEKHPLMKKRANFMFKKSNNVNKNRNTQPTDKDVDYMLLNFRKHVVSSGSEKGDLWCQCACYEDGFMYLIGIDGKMLYYKLTKEGMNLKGFYPTKCIGCT